MTEPKYITIQTRRPTRDGSDPGAIEEGWFIVKDGIVMLTNREGVALHGEENRRELGNEDARVIAVRMLKAKSKRRPSRPFNRPLRYAALKY